MRQQVADAVIKAICGVTASETTPDKVVVRARKVAGAAATCFVKYELVSAAVKAHAALHAREFDGNVVRASFLRLHRMLTDESEERMLLAARALHEVLSVSRAHAPLKTAQSERTESWAAGLCSCFSYPYSCLSTCFCTWPI
mgnify:CR=1 FL=1